MRPRTLIIRSFGITSFLKLWKLWKEKHSTHYQKKNRLLNRVHYFQGCGSGNLSRLILLTTSNDRVPCPVSQQLSGPSDIACAPTATTSSDTANSVATQPAMSMWSQISRWAKLWVEQHIKGRTSYEQNGGFSHQSAHKRHYLSKFLGTNHTWQNSTSSSSDPTSVCIQYYIYIL